MDKVTINLNDISSIGSTAIRRAYAFMGFGINAAENPDQKQVVLPGIVKPRIFPENASNEDLNMLKAGFKTWITGNALRELVEGFEHYFRAVLITLIRTHRSKGHEIDFNKLLRDFDNKGIGGKLELIRKEFNVEIPKSVDFVAINYARNSLTHGRGYIRPRDCNEDKALVMQWRAIEIWVDSNDGEKIPIKSDSDEPIPVQAGGTIKLQPFDQVKKIDAGTPLDLTPKELEGLFFACQIFVNELQNNLIPIFQSIDITINTEENGSDAES
ncbi:hypothetical protein GQF03_03515 [Sneathiella chungangensis]|uniref:Apea-like HEPN domain-containing protein n=1 Tax=Sneathiella chungangensis TaxID=1418234 RepID=A0A845MCK2_9PROT|nr:hypothetical protein [Sneathiella chungangensis]MZR21391.1 hypothetical protein [Sneathiella chungangensis]